MPPPYSCQNTFDAALFWRGSGSRFVRRRGMNATRIRRWRGLSARTSCCCESKVAQALHGLVRGGAGASRAASAARARSGSPGARAGACRHIGGRRRPARLVRAAAEMLAVLHDRHYLHRMRRPRRLAVLQAPQGCRPAADHRRQGASRKRVTSPKPLRKEIHEHYQLAVRDVSAGR